MIRFNCACSISASGHEEVEHGTALFPAACYQDNLTEMPVPWHWHDELEIVVITEGTASFATDRERLELRAGEGCVVNVGIVHGVWNGGADECALRSIVFHPRLIGGAAESVYWQKHLFPLLENRAFQILKLSPEQHADMLEEMKRAWRQCAEEPDGFEITVRNELSMLLFKLSKQVATSAGGQSERVRRNEERLKKMLSYIRAHFSEELSVREISEAAAVSESECIRCFRNSIGTTPIRYVKQLRLQEAAQLLVSTEKKIIEIGNDCGFREMNYFSRSFREQFGVTPTEYRKQKSQP